MADDSDSPHVLWIFLEDVCPWMSCYGEDVIETPNIDAVAREGVRFDRAYMPSPLCSPTRSAVVTGMHQCEIGAHNQDTPDPKPIGVRSIPEIFRAAGYYTFIEGKKHYNFIDGGAFYDHEGGGWGFKGGTDGRDWSGRAPGQPFFGQIQLQGGKTKVNQAPETMRFVDPAKVTVPPYYPDHPAFRDEIAAHYDAILETDRQIGEIVAALKAEGIYESTVLWIFSDHGARLPRHKMLLYEGGIRVPMMVAGPGVPSGEVRRDLVSGLDIGPTSLALAGISTPPPRHGANLLDPAFHRDHIVAARDRCGCAIDRVRAVVTERHKYIRNFMTDRPYLQWHYRDKLGIEFMRVLRELHTRGELDAHQAPYLDDHRPAEELYDLERDPHELHNLIHDPDPANRKLLAQLRRTLYQWILKTDDRGQYPESEEALRAIRAQQGDEWCVNPEFDRVR